MTDTDCPLCGGIVRGDRDREVVAVTDRDRLAADLNSLVATRYTTDVVDWLADRLIALGWTHKDSKDLTVDEERLARALKKAATYTVPATHGRPEAREEQRLWYHGAIASLDWIAKAYREDTDG